MLQKISSRQFGVPRWVPRFFGMLVLACLSMVVRAETPREVSVPGSDFRAAQEALVEAIESEGLVVSQILPFRDMLSRTAQAGQISPFAEAVVVEFCSARIAWQMVREAPENIAFCPLTVALYTYPGDSAIHLAYRQPGGATPAHREADALLNRIVTRAASLARLRW